MCPWVRAYQAKGAVLTQRAQRCSSQGGTAPTMW